MVRRKELQFVGDLEMFTLVNLLERAAKHKGLVFDKRSTHRAVSESIKTYVLDDRLLGVLALAGIEKQERPDCRDRIFTLVDSNPQEPTPGFNPSNYWNFCKESAPPLTATSRCMAAAVRQDIILSRPSKSELVRLISIAICA